MRRLDLVTVTKRFFIPAWAVLWIAQIVSAFVASFMVMACIYGLMALVAILFLLAMMKLPYRLPNNTPQENEDGGNRMRTGTIFWSVICSVFSLTGAGLTMGGIVPLAIGAPVTGVAIIGLIICFIIERIDHDITNEHRTSLEHSLNDANFDRQRLRNQVADLTRDMNRNQQQVRQNAETLYVNDLPEWGYTRHSR